jgi:4-amino-4-deoxy-L-arabinose transferase-like glycosyltransferase
VKIKIDRHCTFLVCSALFFVVANIIWFRADQAPPLWDQSHYLLTSDFLYHLLVNRGIGPFLSGFSEAMGTKAPLLTILPIPFYAIFGDHYSSALAVNLVFILLCFHYVHELVSPMAGRTAAIASGVILNTFPLIIAMSREFLVEYGLMVLVVIWMNYLLKSDRFGDRKSAYALGLTLGLGMLMKISFSLYICLPTCYVVISRMKTDRRLSAAVLKNLAIVMSLGILISGIWYFRNMRHIVAFVLTSGYGNAAMNYGMGKIFSLATVLHYWLYIIVYGISAYAFAVLLLFLKDLFALPSDGASAAPSGIRLGTFLSVWFAAPFIVFTFGVNKDYRYVAPLLPVVAIAIGMSLVRLLSTRRGKAIFSSIFILFILNYLFISFSTRPFSISVHGLPLLSNSLALAHPPVGEHWPYEELIGLLRRDAAKTRDDHARVTLLVDHEYVNRLGARYLAQNLGLDFTFDTCDYNSRDPLNVILARFEQDTSYVVTKSGNLGPDFANVRNKQVLTRLYAGDLGFTKIAAIPLPDDSVLSVYRNNTNNFLLSDTERTSLGLSKSVAAVNFFDLISLVHADVKKTGYGYRIATFWECLNPTAVDYRIFVHVKDAEGRMVSNADHYFARHEYPTDRWKRGDVVRDVAAIPQQSDTDFRIYIGIYDERTGSRLPVKNAPPNSAENVDGVRIY